MEKWIKKHEKNVIIEKIMEKMGNVRRCVRNMMQINRNVEMEK
jgi:hypothetical protein